MTHDTLQFERSPAAIEAYLLGQVEFEPCLALQHRLVFEAGERIDGQIALLICEHPPTLTVGRQGSRRHLRAEPLNLTCRELSPRWINRGGGCLVHAPGQLAIYPIVPLAWHGWSVGEYLRRFQAGLSRALAALHVQPHTRPGRFGLWGRSGQLAAFGVAVKHGVTYHGAFLNVDPNPQLTRAVDGDLALSAPLSSLAAERQKPLPMSLVRSQVLGQLTTAFDCDHYHVYTRHPHLASSPRAQRASRRVG